MQYRHLHQHAIARFRDNNAAWPIEYAISDSDSTAYRQTVHESAVIGRIIEPGFVNTPSSQIEFEFFFCGFIAVTPFKGRRPG